MHTSRRKNLPPPPSNKKFQLGPRPPRFLKKIRNLILGQPPKSFLKIGLAAVFASSSWSLPVFEKPHSLWVLLLCSPNPSRVFWMHSASNANEVGWGGGMAGPWNFLFFSIYLTGAWCPIPPAVLGLPPSARSHQQKLSP